MYKKIEPIKIGMYIDMRAEVPIDAEMLRALDKKVEPKAKEEMVKRRVK